jgi:hypothetical protein
LQVPVEDALADDQDVLSGEGVDDLGQADAHA